MFYAVAKGRKIGIFNTWPECQAQITGFAGPKFKKFETRDEAQAFISQHSSIRVEESDVKPSRDVQMFQLLKKTQSELVHTSYILVKFCDTTTRNGQTDVMVEIVI